MAAAEERKLKDGLFVDESMNGEKRVVHLYTKKIDANL